MDDKMLFDEESSQETEVSHETDKMESLPSELLNARLDLNSSVNEDDKPSVTDNLLNLNSPKQTVLGKLKAKQRLQAFLSPKQNVSPTKKVKDAEEIRMKKPKKTVEKQKSLIEELEQLKREENEIMAAEIEHRKKLIAAEKQKETESSKREEPVSKSAEHDKSERRSRSRSRERKSGFKEHSARSRRSRSLEVKKRRFDEQRYPRSWSEVAQRKLTVEDVRDIKNGMVPSKKKGVSYDFRLQLLFDSAPSIELNPLNVKSLHGPDKIVPPQHLRYTKKLPSIAYSVCSLKYSSCYMTNQEIYNYIPKVHKEVLDSVINPNEMNTAKPSPKRTARKWYPKVPLSSLSEECELLEPSLGLSILQNYTDVEEEELEIEKETFEEPTEQAENVDISITNSLVPSEETPVKNSVNTKETTEDGNQEELKEVTKQKVDKKKDKKHRKKKDKIRKTSKKIKKRDKMKKKKRKKEGKKSEDKKKSKKANSSTEKKLDKELEVNDSKQKKAKISEETQKADSKPVDTKLVKKSKVTEEKSRSKDDINKSEKDEKKDVRKSRSKSDDKIKEHKKDRDKDIKEKDSKPLKINQSSEEKQKNHQERTSKKSKTETEHTRNETSSKTSKSFDEKQKKHKEEAKEDKKETKKKEYRNETTKSHESSNEKQKSKTDVQIKENKQVPELKKPKKESESRNESEKQKDRHNAERRENREVSTSKRSKKESECKTEDDRYEKHKNKTRTNDEVSKKKNLSVRTDNESKSKSRESTDVKRGSKSSNEFKSSNESKLLNESKLSSELNDSKTSKKSESFEEKPKTRNSSEIKHVTPDGTDIKKTKKSSEKKEKNGGSKIPPEKTKNASCVQLYYDEYEVYREQASDITKKLEKDVDKKENIEKEKIENDSLKTSDDNKRCDIKEKRKSEETITTENKLDSPTTPKQNSEDTKGSKKGIASPKLAKKLSNTPPRRETNTPDTEEYHSHWESDEDVRNIISFSPKKLDLSWDSEEEPLPRHKRHRRQQEYSPERTFDRPGRFKKGGERSLEMPLNIKHVSRKLDQNLDDSLYSDDGWLRDTETEKLRHEMEVLSHERKILEMEKRLIAEKLRNTELTYAEFEEDLITVSPRYNKQYRDKNKYAKPRDDYKKGKEKFENDTKDKESSRNKVISNRDSKDCFEKQENKIKEKREDKSKSKRRSSREEHFQHDNDMKFDETIITLDSATDKTNTLEDEYEEFLKAVTNDIAVKTDAFTKVIEKEIKPIKKSKRKLKEKLKLKRKQKRKRKYSTSSSSSSGSSSSSSSRSSTSSNSSSSSSSSSSSNSSYESKKKHPKKKFKLIKPIIENLDDLEKVPNEHLVIKQEVGAFDDIPPMPLEKLIINPPAPSIVPPPEIVPPPNFSLLPIKIEKDELAAKIDSANSPIKHISLYPTTLTNVMMGGISSYINEEISSNCFNINNDRNSREAENNFISRINDNENDLIDIKKELNYSFTISPKKQQQTIVTQTFINENSQDFTEVLRIKKEETLYSSRDTGTITIDDSKESEVIESELLNMNNEFILDNRISDREQSYLNMNYERDRSKSPKLLHDRQRKRSITPKNKRLTSSPIKRHGIERKISVSPRRRKRSRSPFNRKRSFSPSNSRKRSISPRMRSISPRIRSISPRKRSISPRKRSISPRIRSRSPNLLQRPFSPKVRKRSYSPRRRSISPRRRSNSPRRRSNSPRRRSNSPSSRKRSYSPKIRKRSISPKSRTKRYKRSYSRSPSILNKREPIQITLQRLASGEDYKKSPMNSPIDSFKRSVADSTISDEQLLQQNTIAEIIESPIYSYHRKPSPLSPKRIPLDIRINQVLGLEKENVKTTDSSYQNYYNYPDYHQYDYGKDYDVPKRSANQTQVVQIGNVLEVVPRDDLDVGNTVKLSSSSQKILQVGNMLQVVPTPTPVLPPVDHTSTIQPTLSSNYVAHSAASSSTVPSKAISESVAGKSPNESPKAKISPEEIMKEKLAERRAERQRRHAEREIKRLEKEQRRLEKEQKRQIKLKMKTETMIKQALKIETEALAMADSNDEDEESTQRSEPFNFWPKAVTSSPLLKAAGKSILVKRVSKSDNMEENDRKSVKFADGIAPGEGTSPSGGEELSSPPPFKPVLPKEKRFKKIKKKKLKAPKKKKVKLSKKPMDSPDGSDLDSLPPPSPPPGSPPPHIFPARIKTHNINNIHPNYSAPVPFLPVTNFAPQQYRAALPNVAVPPPTAHVASIPTHLVPPPHIPTHTSH